MTTDDIEACDFAMQLMSSSVLPMILKTAIELDLFEIMAKSGERSHEMMTAGEIAAQLPTKNPEASVMLDRMLQLLASHKVLVSTAAAASSNAEGETVMIRRYGLSPVCKFFVRNEDGVSIAPMALLVQDKVHIESWYHLKDAVLEGGIPSNRAYGMDSFDYHGTNPRFNKIFNNGMLNHSTILMKKILDTYNGFEGLGSLVDVGGGVGTNLSRITAKYPDIKGINFDLHHVIENAPRFTGVQHISGDMFTEIPKGDAIFMKWILHDWGDDHCLKFLRNCYSSLPDHGKVIIVESLLPEAVDNSYGSQAVFQMDCIMMAQNPGGKERTQKEFEKLIKAAGFGSIKLICRVYNFWVIEVYKE